MKTKDAIKILLKMLQGYATFSQRLAIGKAIKALKQPEKKAKWSEKGVYNFACTNCDYRVMEPVNYCPNCGAEMEGEE